jgi:hypothetical protein
MTHSRRIHRVPNNVVCNAVGTAAKHVSQHSSWALPGLRPSMSMDRN